MIVVRGIEWIPLLIQLAGRGGRIETAEWVIYLLLGFLFPLLVVTIGWFAIGRVNQRWLHLLFAALGIFVLVKGALFTARTGIGGMLASLLFALALAGSAVIIGRLRNPGTARLDTAELALTVVVLAFAWSACFRLASWTSGAGWIMQSPQTPVILGVLALVGLTVFGLSRNAGERGGGGSRWKLSPADMPALAAFLYLSFRTYPIAEFYHWSFWVGPIEAVKQGGWLLWDVPSQYGFLSILLPSLIPTPNAWVSLYVVQGFLYAVVATGMFMLLRSFRRSWLSSALAFSVTASTLFFRPRSEELLLAAQMTPAGGPMRFFWPFAVLAVIAWKYQRRDVVGFWRFALTGTLVWITGVAWSAESAIYCTAAWLAAYTVALVQHVVVERRRSGIAWAEVSAAIALPLLAALCWIGVTALVYRVMGGQSPDWMSYYEYALLFSGGYSALTIDLSGPVWYLVAIFALISTAGIYFIRTDALHARVMVAAAAWGTVWAVSSYFVSRSHPVNLLSLTPLLIVSCALVFRAARRLEQRWLAMARLAFVPLLTVPAALTLAHPNLVAELRQPQISPSIIASQIPPLDASLVALARTAGMTPADPVFYVSDGKFIMPPWPPDSEKAVVQTSATSWMPKPYEMISTLPAWRRNEYMSRFGARTGLGGWLVQRKADVNPAYRELLGELSRSYARTKAFQNDKWIIEQYTPRAALPNQP